MRQVGNDTQHLAKDPRLLVRTDAIGIQSDQAHACSAIYLGANARQFGCRRGLANARRAHQSENPTFFVQTRTFGIGSQVALQNVPTQCTESGRIQIRGRLLQHRACQIR